MTIIQSISLNLHNDLPIDGKIVFEFPENLLFPGTDQNNNVISAIEC